MNKRNRVFIVGGVVVLVGLLSFGAGAGAKGRIEQISGASSITTADAAKATPGGFVCVRGRTICDAPVMSPVTGTKCLSFTYSADAEYSERVVDKTDPNKTKTETKHRSLGDDKQIAKFALDDGSGPVRIDAAAGGDIEMTDVPAQTYVTRAANEGAVRLGNLSYSVTGFPMGTTFTATERVLLPTDAMFACGRIENGVLGTSDLILSTKSREEVLTDYAGTAALGSAMGWVLTLLGVAVLGYGVLLMKKM